MTNRSWYRSPTRCPWCSGTSSEKPGFKLKALLSFQKSKSETGCFQARVKLAPPYLGGEGVSQARDHGVGPAKVFRHLRHRHVRHGGLARRGNSSYVSSELRPRRRLCDDAVSCQHHTRLATTQTLLSPLECGELSTHLFQMKPCLYWRQEGARQHFSWQAAGASNYGAHSVSALDEPPDHRAVLAQAQTTRFKLKGPTMVSLFHQVCENFF